MATRREKRRKLRNEQNQARRAAIRAAAKDRGVIQAAAVSLEWIEAASDEKKRRFRINAYSGGSMRVSNYGPPIAIELSGLQANAPIPILLDHDPTQIVGHADDMAINRASLSLDGIISGVGEAAEKVAAMAANGFPWRASVGVLPDEMEYIGEGKTVKANGKTLKGPLYLARTSELKEVSFVAVAADSRTSTKVAASSPTDKEHDMKFNEWLKAKFALDADTLSDESREKFEAAYKAEQEPPKADPPVEPIKAATPKEIIERREAEAREVERVRDIRAICAKYRPDINDDEKTSAIEASGIRNGSDVRDVELECVKASRPPTPAIHAKAGGESWPGIEAAFCRSAGVKDLEKRFTPQVLEASDRYGTLSIGRLLLLAAQANGYTGMPWVDGGTLRPIMQAAFTTHNITDLLTRTGNKVLSDGFALAPTTWREVCSTKPVKDFKATRVFRMTDSLEYKEIGPGGQFHHGALGQESYDIQAKTYGRMLALTRTDIINDDLGAFDDLRRRLGIYAGVTINKLVWTAWLTQANAGTFWTAARGNYQSGAATTLSEAGINTAVALFRQQRMPAPGGADATDEQGLLNLYPTKVICPPDLEATARKFYVSTEMRDTTSSTKYPTTNVWFNQFRPVIVPELSDSSYTGYSATGWWLACEPGMLATFNVCFLNGVEQPIVESTDADFETLGIRFRAYTDFGVDDAEYRASLHSAGA